MINGVSAPSTALTTQGSNPSRSSPADIRAYLDFQILFSRVSSGQQPLVTAEAAGEPQVGTEVAPAGIEQDSGFQEFIAQRQLELSLRLNAEPERVDRLTLMLLADAYSAGSQSAPTTPEPLRYPLTLA
ncbi:hypothetical protein LJY18_12180 [Pseudomonas sp. MMS21-TM103]|uniref:hypothetical protein n=1 Tax=unclassified Pseudomonas TaxID=196821 RepID=UPI001EDFB6C8|nr:MULTISPECIES: hypothetical protein [unclassified Pseudomonas]MCG4454055.1 hypothetical protein [Pseudomonas sp. MMS21 TM103]